MEIHNGNLDEVLPQFSEARCDDCHAICDLAMYNYVEVSFPTTKPQKIYNQLT